MVRLKVHVYMYTCKRLIFQFHYGTIKSAQMSNEFNAAQLFQFHYGTIKSRHTSLFRFQHLLFQFHYGTIKSNIME